MLGPLARRSAAAVCGRGVVVGRDHATRATAPGCLLISDPLALEAKIQTIRDSLCRLPSHQLVVVTDFDRTITSCGSDECHGILGSCPLMPAPFRAKMHAMLTDPMGVDPGAEGRDAPGWWWREAHAWLQTHGFRESFLAPALDAASVKVRQGARQLLEQSAAPVLVVSAGVSQIISRVFEREGLPARGGNVDIFANKMIFGGGDHLIGWETVHPQDSVVHSGNKAETFNMINNNNKNDDDGEAKKEDQDAASNFFRAHTMAKTDADASFSAVVLGDSLGDARAADGIPLVPASGSGGGGQVAGGGGRMAGGGPPPSGSIIRIGILNEARDSPSVREQYLDAFDVVMLSSDARPASLNYALSLLDTLSSSAYEGSSATAAPAMEATN